MVRRRATGKPTDKSTEPIAIPGGRRTGVFLLIAGPVLLFLIAVCYGVTERHSSTDTWIALAAGRQILTTGQVPRVDTFSYTFAGQPWFNQNWLSHVFFYWLYAHISPAAVIVGTWAMSAAIFGLVLVAVRLRSGSWLASWIGASFVALGGYGYLSARPATVGFLLLAALMAVLSALAVPGFRKRWWLGVLLLPLFGVWGCAHGTFFFGYGLVGVFVACWFATWLFRPLAASTTMRQVVVAIAACGLAAVLTVTLGPYGIDNFMHPFKVAGSEVFREVSEWHSPFVKANYPPVGTFWASLGVAGGALLIGGLLRLAAGSVPRQRGAAAGDGPRLGLFDVAVVLLGLYMALWARRFAPLFYILAAPTIVTAVVLLTARVPDVARRYGRVGLAVAACVMAIVVGWQLEQRLRRHYVEPYRQQPELGILERATVYEKVPQPAIEFLHRNNLKARLMTEWTLAGPAMVYAPQTKVFIDGRSQQVYDEDHYLRYKYLTTMGTRDRRYAERARGILGDFDTDTVLVNQSPKTIPLMQALADDPEWTLLMARRFWVMFMRPNSPVFEQLAELEHAGQASWPPFPEAEVARAKVWAHGRPPDYDRALEHYQAAVAGQAVLGRMYYAEMVRLWIHQSRLEEAAAYFQQQARRFSQPSQDLDERVRRDLLDKIAQCWHTLRQAGARLPG